MTIYLTAPFTSHPFVLSRQLCKAIWHGAPISKAMITVNKGAHFHNMGHAIKGEMWLYPEECLFLMDRCSLSMQYCGVDMSLQQAYCEIIGGWLTLEKYQVRWRDEYFEYFINY